MHSLQYIGNIIPEEFKVIGFCYLSPIGEDEEGRMEFELEYDIFDEADSVTPEIEEIIKDQACDKKGRCNHCNAHIAYIYIVKSLKEGTIHTFGSTCGINLQGFSNSLILNAQELNLKARVRIRNEKKRREFLDKNEGLEEALKYKHYIIESISDKFYQYFSLSEKQVELVYKIIADQEKWKAEKAEAEKDYIKGHHFTDGARVTIEVKKIGKGGSFETAFGTTYIENYISTDNMVFKYMGSNPPDISADEFVKIKATVKHDNYKDIPETKLQRIKVVTSKQISLI